MTVLPVVLPPVLPIVLPIVLPLGGALVALVAGRRAADLSLVTGLGGLAVSLRTVAAEAAGDDAGGTLQQRRGAAVGGRSEPHAGLVGGRPGCEQSLEILGQGARDVA